MADLSDEAVTEVARAMVRDTLLDRWDDLDEHQRDVYIRLARAALPVLNTAKDSETAEPELIMGTHPDGAPWVISAEFAGPTVRVNGHGILRLYGKAVAPWEAHRIAKGLLAAIAWLENDGAAKAEAAASLRGEQ